MLNKRISLCYVLGNVHDINDDQEGQVPSLEMPCSSAEFHYTEAEPLCCCRPALTFQDASPRGNANFQYLLTRQHSNVRLPATCWGVPQGWCLFFSHFLSWENWYSHCTQIPVRWFSLFLLGGPCLLYPLDSRLVIGETVERNSWKEYVFISKSIAITTPQPYKSPHIITYWQPTLFSCHS